MGNTKIFVVHMKEIIKTAVFVILGIILICLIVYALGPKTKDETALYTPGSYSSTIILNNNPVEVSVSVDERTIKSVELLNMSEEQAVFYPLMQPTLTVIADEVVRTQTVNVDIPAESEYTGQILLKAVDLALAKARI